MKRQRELVVLTQQLAPHCFQCYCVRFLASEMRILPVFLLFFCVLFQYAHPDPSYSKNCPPFACGKLGQIVFPFTNTTQTEECGPFVVRGCSEDLREVQLERGSGKWYQLEGISQADVISITDREFQAQLNNTSCESFNNLSFPKLNFSHSFQIISENITLLKCRNFKADSNFTKFCLEHRDCPDFIIYYPPPNKTLPSPPPGCTIIVLPTNISNSHDDIFRLLTATFSLSALVPPPCYQCYLQGNCTGEHSDCNKVNAPPLGRKNETNNPKAYSEALGLGIGLGVGGPVAIAILVLIRCLYKRKHAPSDFTTTNNSFDNSSNTTLPNAGNAYFTVPIFSYDELEEATNNFDPQGELGDGGFGTVYYGRLRDGREVAVKRLYERNYKKVMQFMNEIEILTRLRHPNLVSLYGCTSRHSRELLLVYEYISNGTVADHLHGDRAMPGQPSWPIRMRIAIETASALSYLHASGIIHRDVKTNNILLDMNFCVKVADFGISRLFPINVTHVSTAPQGTPGYVDPEYHQCYQLTDKSDVYSFGVVLIELISSLPAVDITRERHEINLATLAINKIQKCEFEELIDTNLGYNTDEEIERMITSVAELAFRCLQQDKEMRPSMDEVLEELIMIEGKKNELENSDEKQNDNTRKKSVEPLHTAQYPNEISLLKNMHPPPNSPNSTVEKWLNSYTTRSI